MIAHIGYTHVHYEKTLVSFRKQLLANRKKMDYNISD